MLHVSSLFVAGSAAVDEDGAINATRIPMTWFQVDQIPLWGQVPLVVVVHAPAGGDYNPELFVVCKNPDGVALGSLRAAWHWPDDDKSSKYRCFTQQLAFRIESEGEYTFGAYYDAEGRFEMSTPIPVSIVLAPQSPDTGSGGDTSAETPLHHDR